MSGCYSSIEGYRAFLEGFVFLKLQGQLLQVLHGGRPPRTDNFAALQVQSPSIILIESELRCLYFLALLCHVS